MPCERFDWLADWHGHKFVTAMDPHLAALHVEKFVPHYSQLSHRHLGGATCIESLVTIKV